MSLVVLPVVCLLPGYLTLADLYTMYRGGCVDKL
jgi:hypothetical protein